MHIYNADEFLEERAVKQNERDSMKKKKKRRSGMERRRMERERKKTKGSFSGVSDHQDTERRAEQQVYMKKALRSIAKRYLESE